MSVINQMLKDLEQRNNEPENAQVNYVPPVPVKASKKPIFVIISILVAINIIGIIIWQLYSENQSLKYGTTVKSANINNTAEQPTTQQTSTSTIAKSDAQGLSKPMVVNADNTTNTVRADTSPNNAAQVEKIAAKIQPQKTSKLVTANTKNANNTQNLTSPSSASNSPMEVELPESDSLVEEPSPINSPAVDSLNNASQAEPELTVVKERKVANSNTSAKPVMSVTRRQLSPDELAAQKLSKAEQAIAKGDAALAETLFEDILLIQPENKFARKKLAALWFGRKAYQSAVNLLAQGIDLFPNDSEFRLMQAQVYLSVNNAQAALAALKPMNQFSDKEYQLMLASTAQQVGDFETAASAYQTLTTLVNNNGRYWLGLAIALDSNGQYQQAKDAYLSALAVGDLAKSSTDFATQRLQELGE